MQVRLHCNQSHDIPSLLAKGEINHQSLFVSCCRSLYMPSIKEFMCLYMCVCVCVKECG